MVLVGEVLGEDDGSLDWLLKHSLIMRRELGWAFDKELQLRPMLKLGCLGMQPVHVCTRSTGNPLLDGTLPSLPFPSLPFPALPFPSLPFPSLPFPSRDIYTGTHGSAFPVKMDNTAPKVDADHEMRKVFCEVAPSILQYMH